jgi:hypothetical protein
MVRVPLSKFVQALVRRAGFDVHSLRSEHHLALDYAVSSKPRYGYKTGPHTGMLRLLDERSDVFERTLSEIESRSDLFRGIPAKSSGEPLSPYWDQGWFPPLDACALMHFLLSSKPNRYIEIGSGNSTIFTHHAKTVGGLATHISSIDPQPRAGIDALCDRVIRSRLEDTDLSIFDELEPGDFLFFDGSHRVFPDSDVTVFFLDVLTRVKPGVIVHVHDIFWPNDYPPAWGERYYSEQYMLAVAMLYAPEKYEVLFPCVYVGDRFDERVAALTNGERVFGVWGTGFWFRKNG